MPLCAFQLTRPGIAAVSEGDDGVLDDEVELSMIDLVAFLSRERTGEDGYLIAKQQGRQS